MKIQSKILVAALAMTLPALALAAQPLAVRYDGHDMPMHQTVEVMHTAAGPVQVKTWTWQSPQGHARVVIEQSSGAAAPAWALRQMHTQFAPMQRLIDRVDAQMNAQRNAVVGPMSTLRVLLRQSTPVVRSRLSSPRRLRPRIRRSAGRRKTPARQRHLQRATCQRHDSMKYCA